MLPLVFTIRMLKPSQKSVLKLTKRRNTILNSTIADKHQLSNSITCKRGQKAQNHCSYHWVPLFPEHDDPNSATDSSDAFIPWYAHFISSHLCFNPCSDHQLQNSLWKAPTILTWFIPKVTLVTVPQPTQLTTTHLQNKAPADQDCWHLGKIRSNCKSWEQSTWMQGPRRQNILQRQDFVSRH